MARRHEPVYPVVFGAINAMNVAGIPLFYTHQNVAELWNVMTRPAEKNGFGLSVEQVEIELLEIESRMSLLEESAASYRRWRALVSEHRVQGVQVHDARLVAAMQANHLQHILTLNISDFARFSGIRAIHPQTILKAQVHP
jgi:predicted nucleic acid-binding protein